MSWRERTPAKMDMHEMQERTPDPENLSMRDSTLDSVEASSEKGENESSSSDAAPPLYKCKMQDLAMVPHPLEGAHEISSTQSMPVKIVFKEDAASIKCKIW